LPGEAIKRRRVRTGVDFAQMADIDFGVDLGGIELGMAEELTDEADVGSILEHVGGAAVS